MTPSRPLGWTGFKYWVYVYLLWSNSSSTKRNCINPDLICSLPACDVRAKAWYNCMPPQAMSYWYLKDIWGGEKEHRSEKKMQPVSQNTNGFGWTQAALTSSGLEQGFKSNPVRLFASMSTNWSCDTAIHTCSPQAKRPFIMVPTGSQAWRWWIPQVKVQLLVTNSY